jgi:SAM-dependent methyltransferase
VNRKTRRAALKRGKAVAIAPPVNATVRDIGGLIAEARRHYKYGQFAHAQDICNEILVRDPSHIHALNLSGIIAQTSDRHNVAIKMFSKAIALDKLNAACHYNLASSYQALGRSEDAVAHFRKAIALRLSDKDVEEFILQNSVAAAAMDRIAAKWPLPIKFDELLWPQGIAAIVNDLFLRCALESTTVRGTGLEMLLTQIRSGLLHIANTAILESRRVDDNIVRLFCALAQNCFLNEYVFAQSDEEVRQVTQLREMLAEHLASSKAISPLLLVAVAAYFPLNSMPKMETLLNKNLPEVVTNLLRQQIREPIEETQDRNSIARLTVIEDNVSLQVKQQYDENPYPRWTINPIATFADDQKRRTEKAGNGAQNSALEILIAGCGTGQHAVLTGAQYPDARVLAVDLSLASLAYARRKTQEEGLRNVEYAQADILKLATINRSFDLIESIGVLHHLADPWVGWRILLSLLRRDGEMVIGLYSETARRAVVEARALITERGYRATIEDIRRCRQEIIRDANTRGWQMLTRTADFYSTSGCRDLLFNVMEHRFTIPKIVAFLKENNLSFVGFNLEPSIFEKFQKFSGGAAVTDLSQWHAFETANPQTFQKMYVFAVRRNRSGD